MKDNLYNNARPIQLNKDGKYEIMEDTTIGLPTVTATPVAPKKLSKMEMLKEAFEEFKVEIAPYVKQVQEYAASRNEAINENRMFDNGGLRGFGQVDLDAMQDLGRAYMSGGFGSAGMDLEGMQDHGRAMIATGMSTPTYDAPSRKRGRRKRSKIHASSH